MARDDLTGRIFGNWTVLNYAGLVKQKHAKWNCVCKCGNRRPVFAQSLKSGASRGCGCTVSKMATQRLTKHGKSSSPVYKGWAAMKDRCFNPRNTHYAEYGGRGITVCDRWRYSFTNFLKDMGERKPGMTIERIDNDGNYEPGNCKWATRREQQRNRRACNYLNFNGETLCISEWADRTGLRHETIRSRLNRGWSIEKTLSTPRLSQGSKN